MGSMRWLCLHGAGGNAETFESQLASLQYIISKQHGDTFHYIDATVAGKESDTLDYNGVTEGPFLHWWDLGNIEAHKDSGAEAAKANLQKSVDKAHQQVKQAMLEHGPFDGIIGYSQGGTLISDLLIRSHYDPSFTIQEQPLKMVVMLGTPPPPEVWSPGLDLESIVTGERLGKVLKMPAVWVIGDQDIWLNDSGALKGCWVDGAVVDVSYEGLHTLPGAQKVWEDVAGAVGTVRG